MIGEEQAETKRFKRFLTMFFAGFFILFLGVVFLAAAALLSGTGVVNVGGVIFIWFFPIVFGAGPEAHWLMLIAVILAVLSLVVLLTTRKTVGKGT
ncbi:MAG: DUF131 domain-containing protein [Candidatus Bathyarchaeota archaeon]|nr:DUF131 domain-containing protein [Candidatus Bathyarchaeota archaeon]MDW8040844.1 DUF131 domain-containing protein [Nitrososphaerota archaeon]